MSKGVDRTYSTELSSQRFKKYGQRQLKTIEEGSKVLKETEGMDIKEIVKKHKEGINQVDITTRSKISLFNKLKREERETMSLLMGEIDKLENTKSNIRNLKKTLYRIHMDIRRGYDDDVHISMSFVCKKSKGIPYIKCRVWWDGVSEGTGGQREVQVGSIPKIIDTFNEHIGNKEEGFPKRKLSDDLKELSWDEFKENKKLMKLLRMISKPLFRKYLISKLLSRRTLGYRIRTKDSVGVSKHLDTSLIVKEVNHLTKEEKIQFLKDQEEHKQTKWYKTLKIGKSY